MDLELQEVEQEVDNQLIEAEVTLSREQGAGSLPRMAPIRVPGSILYNISRSPICCLAWLSYSPRRNAKNTLIV